jgi:Heparinase II/III-like protein/Heparinase II/III N-terminus
MSQRYLLNRLRKLGPPEPTLLGSSVPIPTAAGLREGQFKVYGRAVTLTPPIDWQQDPYDSRSWCYQLHSLIWLTPALRAYAASGDQVPLVASLRIFDDWISVHLENPIGISEFAWYDMAVSQRAPSLAFALRAALVENLLDDSQAELLLRACDRHGTELADDAKYSAGHNHGLAQDEALYLLARQLPVLSSAPEWSELALRRMRLTLGETISEQEGAHLEHSSAYQFAITGMVSRLCQSVPEWPELDHLHDRLRRTAAWHVTPTGTIMQMGDGDDSPAPAWAVTESSQQQGMRALYNAGNAFVRKGDSYLAVSCGYHSAAHKHADDAGFLLFERGKTVFGDAGRWGYYEDEPDREYARSAHAHNVLTVDEQDFDWRNAKPYGSGLIAASESDGWYVILVTNPLLASQEVSHRRLFLYRPGEALLVIDQISASAIHTYERRFHFGLDLRAQVHNVGRISIVGPGITADLIDVGRTSEIRLSRGQDQPVRSGWTYPRDRERVPIDTATLRCRARSANVAAALTLRDTNLSIDRAMLDGERAIVETNQSTIEVRLDTSTRRVEIHVTPVE